MFLDDAPRDGESESRSASTLREEGFKYLWQHVWRKTGTAILHHALKPVGIILRNFPRFDCHQRTGGRMQHRVLDEVLKDLPQPPVIHLNRRESWFDRQS